MHYVTYTPSRTLAPQDTMGVSASRDGHVSTLEKAALQFSGVHSYRSAVGGDDPRLRPKVDETSYEKGTARCARTLGRIV